ncbi:hypothetical protein [Thalassospira sp. ER-Se-21-Dark]|uniref:hypothetical protein n=1 Tax=Thalassospira sp. ER-Se-21-Dark TaxID=2585190 RepID=UPI001B30BDA1|nr:hypothetical protein [Thalassospira sp. ER-Se-21-Dark]MBP3127364.1 hypothetical protein [Thalassospira sp. ER-Se-21-Dark]
MQKVLRKLNDKGTYEFRQYILSGAVGEPPYYLLEDKETSSPLKQKVALGSGVFEDRYQFGVYLNSLLSEFNPAEISGDSGLWNALALFWFERICPKMQNGDRDTKKEYKYILSEDFRHYYRHLIRSPWQLVKDHGASSQFLLISPKKRKFPLSTQGEIFEQLLARQQIFGSSSIIRAANKLYFDQVSFRPKTGVAGRGRGCAQRFGLVLRQLALTYDAEQMSEEALIGILPGEFERWKT